MDELVDKPHIYCNREFIKCSICGSLDNYGFNTTEHFFIVAATEGKPINGSYPIASIECMQCHKKAKTNQDPYFYY
ncbi:hypothetical protein BS636_13405 [Acinetobacter sp. LoGeW2-3]|uniref:hypothetical protein n=1 Tax=Acinetobacter sp. LoGeW2-3 TaxID=1808001 RepID=UPI000C05C9E1|nr:hypothetical protein [Acinetobacter sp. LoGeW2-3]ATO21081.1 hypothetical protein BS636_13405 [Acinetobacter sp. LoGeW2-3]